VHIEIVHSLDTDAMINTLRRFISLRGCPKEIRSDCGTNFVKADKELKNIFQIFKFDKSGYKGWRPRTSRGRKLQTRTVAACPCCRSVSK
jgi:hypothetical protein